MIRDTAEKCKACTLKHLSEAYTILISDDDIDTTIKGAHIYGNLLHAANHVVEYSEDLYKTISKVLTDHFTTDLATLNVEGLQNALIEITRRVYTELPSNSTDHSITIPTIMGKLGQYVR